MFQGCTGISSAPELPAVSPAQYCYGAMFRGTSITTPPELRLTATAQGCCDSMFYDCVQLTAAPALSVKSMSGAYTYRQMFQNCSRLSAAPELPATKLTANCYNGMFQNCTSLTAAPKLPAGTLATGCYTYMFQGCTSLASVEVSFSAWNGVATSNWLNNVSAQGTFTCPTALGTQETITRGVSNCPAMWTVDNV